MTKHKCQKFDRFSNRLCGFLMPIKCLKYFLGSHFKTFIQSKNYLKKVLDRDEDLRNYTDTYSHIKNGRKLCNNVNRNSLQTIDSTRSQ